MSSIVRPVLLLLSVLVLFVLFNSQKPAGAVGTEMALDVGDVRGNSATSIGNINQCLQVASGASYTVDVVLIDVTDAVASQFTLSYSGSVDARDVSTSLLNEEKPDVGGSAVIETGISDPAPDTDGSHLLAVTNDAAIGSGGASGSGVLVRLTMTAPTTVIPMLVNLKLSGTAIADSNADEIRHSTKDAALAVAGATCQQVSPTPTAAPPETSPTAPIIDSEVWLALTGQPAVSVIIYLWIGVPPTADLPTLVAAVDAAQQAVLSSLTQGDFSLRDKYGAIPELAGDITIAGLQKLSNSPYVVRITIDWAVGVTGFPVRVAAPGIQPQLSATPISATPNPVALPRAGGPAGDETGPNAQVARLLTASLALLLLSALCIVVARRRQRR